MPWFTAWLVMECEVVGADPLCDEQLRLIEASDAEAAYVKAVEIGAEEEHSYENPDGDIVRWVFKGLSNLEEVMADSIESGTEIWSTIHDGTRAEELVRPKEKFTTSWSAENQNTTAGELLDPKRRRYAPR